MTSFVRLPTHPIRAQWECIIFHEFFWGSALVWPPNSVLNSAWCSGAACGRWAMGDGDTGR